jgi:hypothetical protein
MEQTNNQLYCEQQKDALKCHFFGPYRIIYLEKPIDARMYTRTAIETTIPNISRSLAKSASSCTEVPLDDGGTDDGVAVSICLAVRRCALS